MSLNMSLLPTSSGDEASPSGAPAVTGHEVNGTASLGTVTMEQLSNVNVEQIVVKQCLESNGAGSVAAVVVGENGTVAVQQANGSAVSVCAVDNALLQQAMVQADATAASAFLLKSESAEFAGVDPGMDHNACSDVFGSVSDLDGTDAFQVATLPDEPISGRKSSKSGADEEIKICEFCQRSGSAATFYSATKRFCSVGCCHRFSASHQRPRRVAMRSMREANTPRRRRESRREQERDRGSELYRSSETIDSSYDMYSLGDWSADQLTTESTSAELDSMGVPVLPTYNMTISSGLGKKFDWPTHLQETGAVAAPYYCFPERHFPQQNLFEVEMKVELAVDLTQTPCNAHLVTIAQVCGMRVRCTYDGSSGINSEWRCIDAMDIFPLGWCASQGGSIVPPPDCQVTLAQNWPDFLEKALKRAVGVPDNCFPLKSTPTLPAFLPGHKLEMSLEDGTGTRYCVVTVAKFVDDNVVVHLDGYKADNEYYYTLPHNTPLLHPVGYCSERHLKLHAPQGVTDDMFDWESYLEFTSAIPAPRELFRSTNNLFLAGMKLEAVDSRNPNMVCVATVAEAIGNDLKIHFEGWSDRFDAVVKKDDPNIFPVGWCAKYGQTVTPPPVDKGAVKSVALPTDALSTNGSYSSTGSVGKRKRSSVADLASPTSKKKSNAKVSAPRAIFNIECDHGPFLDNRKVQSLPAEVAGTSAANVLKRVLQFLIDAGADQRTVFDMVRSGHNSVTVHCFSAAGERFVKHLQNVDRMNILWGIIKNMLQKLQCCERFITPKVFAGQCTRCSTVLEGLSGTAMNGHPAPYDAASVSGTPMEQQYATDGGWLPSGGSTSTPMRREVDLIPLPQSFNPSRPAISSTGGGSVILNSGSSLRPDAGLFNNPKIEYLANKNPKTWSVEDVKAYFECSECAKHVSTLVEQEIDGNAMLLLTPDSLVRYMGLRLGPSLKICGRVEGLKTKWNIH